MSNPESAFGLTVGDRIRLVAMGDDPCPMEAGATGTVYMLCEGSGLDQVCVQWDAHVGRSLNLVPGVDRWEKLGDEIPVLLAALHRELDGQT